LSADYLLIVVAGRDLCDAGVNHHFCLLAAQLHLTGNAHLAVMMFIIYCQYQ